ncbi:MAG: RNA methyltransferase [Leptolyngbya sp. SIOISBB]|nr:RNA methyltransferase [Leptolyngbya sp. SIOISBB]
MVHPRLQHIRIILVEPAGALNVGAAARVMANMGLSHLVLVNPHCDPKGEEARRMAVHAGELLAHATTVSTLPEALTDCTRAIATTGRDRALNTAMEMPEAALPWLLSPEAGGASASAALIFGPEDRGLSNEELNYAQRFVRIPSDASYTSLNLAQAIAVCCYELARAVAPRTMSSAQPPPPQMVGETASLEQLEGFHQHLEAVLLKIGYLYPHTAASRMEKLRRFFVRATPTSQELAMLRGILRQTEWALTQVEHLPSSIPEFDSQDTPQG